MNNPTSDNEKVYKTPKYTRKAIAEYHERNKDDPKYKEKRQQYQKKYYETKKQNKIVCLDICELIKNNKIPNKFIEKV